MTEPATPRPASQFLHTPSAVETGSTVTSRPESPAPAPESETSGTGSPKRWVRRVVYDKRFVCC